MWEAPTIRYEPCELDTDRMKKPVRSFLLTGEILWGAGGPHNLLKPIVVVFPKNSG